MLSWKQLLVVGIVFLGSYTAKAEFGAPMGAPIGYVPVAVQQTRLSVVNTQSMYNYGAYGSHGMSGYGGGYGGGYGYGGYGYGGYGYGYGYGGYGMYGGYRRYGHNGCGGQKRRCASHHRCCSPHRKYRSFSLGLSFGGGGFSFGLNISKVSF